jgi:glycerophosphoryl diester phosphodiesterase
VLLLLLPVLSACAAGARSADASCPPSPFRSERPIVIAHASGDWFGPPNSIEMMDAALVAGADVLDLDIRVTRDGKLVAAHDDRIGNVSVEEATLAELQQIDLRDLWTNAGNKNLPKPVRIPTIEAALITFPDRRFSLEFKTVGGEQTMCDLLRRIKRTSSVYVSSAGDSAVDTFKPLCPEVVTTVTDAMVPIMQAAEESGEDWCAPVPIGQPPLSQGDFVLTKEAVAWEQAHGLASYTWTADDEETLRTVKSLGVDGVYTARPDLAQEIFDEA